MIASVPRPAAARAGSAGRLLGPAGMGTDSASGDASGGAASSAARRDGLPAGLAAHIAAALRRVSGLEIDLVGARSVERAVGERIQALIAQRTIDDAWSYTTRIEQDAEERQWLIEAAVVPETWFFRHRESFDFLALQARQRYYGGNGGTTARVSAPLRIASVPCSTGEEPYSIAMTLLRDGLPPSAFLIDAMDISAVALAQAEAGVYRPNAFRGCPDSLRDRYFTARSQPVLGSAIRETVWDINGEVRAGVSFRRVNLVADARVGADTGQGGVYDFIFCRNVLIYFDRPTQAAVIDKLRQALRPGGFLLVGPAEAALVSRAGLAAAAAPLAFAFHRDAPQVSGTGAPRAATGTSGAVPPSLAKSLAPGAASGAPSVGGSSTVAGKAGWSAASGGVGLSSTSALPGAFPRVPTASGNRGAASAPSATPSGATAASTSGRGAGAPGAAAGTPRRAPIGGAPLSRPASPGARLSDVAAADPKQGAAAAAYAEAERLANLGDVVEAMQRCQALVTQGAGNADVYCLMGVLADAGGHSADAREHFRRALYLDANHAGALMQFAEHLAMEGDDAGAQRLMARARRAHPDLF